MAIHECQLGINHGREGKVALALVESGAAVPKGVVVEAQAVEPLQRELDAGANEQLVGARACVEVQPDASVDNLQILHVQVNMLYANIIVAVESNGTGQRKGVSE